MTHNNALHGTVLALRARQPMSAGVMRNVNMTKKLELAKSTETEKRKREIQLIINVIEPDPEYQPLFISDEANLFDLTLYDKSELEEKLRFYFKGNLPAPIETPLWKYVDLIKQRYPEWPNNWPPENP